jgi:crossover junction endodeoxyribonuclease RuvC
MTIIIGIDPGSRHTGYGVIDVVNGQSIYLTSGCIHLAKEQKLPERLQKIFAGLQEVVDSYNPVEASIEQVFMHENPGSALKLGQARGAAIVSLKIPVAEYSARQVKQAVVGYGAAKKDQVQQMVMRLLNISEKLQSDEADALAIALCHAHSRLAILKVGLSGKNSQRRKSNSWRDYRPGPE